MFWKWLLKMVWEHQPTNGTRIQQTQSQERLKLLVQQTVRILRQQILLEKYSTSWSSLLMEDVVIYNQQSP